MPFIIPIIVAIATVASIVATAVQIISSFKPPSPGKISFGVTGSSGGSPRYGTFGPLDNTVSNELPVPVLYGQLKVAGNVIWQTDPGDTVSRIVGLCEGLINDVRDVRANDVPINDSAGATPGSNFTVYLGTNTQKADSRLPADLRPKMELHNTAYLAVTLKVSDKIKGGNPALTCVVQGLLVETWNSATQSWGTTKVFSRNPAACIRDFLLNARYGMGLARSAIDDASFGSVYEYCEEEVSLYNTTVTDGGPGTVLLLHGDGPNLSNVFLDSSRNNLTVEAFGGAIIDTTVFKVGNASINLNGTDAYLKITNPAGAIFDANDYTLQGWIRLRATGGFQVIVLIGQIGNQTYVAVDSDHILFEASKNGTTVIQIIGSTILAVNTFYHIRVTRSGSNFRLYVDGVQEGTTTNGRDTYSEPILVSGGDIYVGSQQGGLLFNGWIDDLQVVNGVALSVFDFQVPEDNEARFRMDYIIDSLRPAQDILNDMLGTFFGFLIYSGSKLKLGVERAATITQYFGDGSTTTQNATFDPNNIVRDSLGWSLTSLDEKPNRVKVQWVDPNQNYVKVFTQVEDKADQDFRNTVITKEISLLGVTRQTQASRLAKMFLAINKFANINISFSARLDSIHCEVGDVVAVTHQASKFTRKLFRITDMNEGEDETIQINAKEYNASVYDDRLGTNVQILVQPVGPNLFSPLDDVT